MSVTDISFRDISIPFSFKVLLSHNLEHSFLAIYVTNLADPFQLFHLKTNKDCLVNQFHLPIWFYGSLYTYTIHVALIATLNISLITISFGYNAQKHIHVVC